MRESQLTSVYDDWTTPSSEVRVRGTMFLWGSEGVTENITFNRPLVLHIRNDVFGEDITFGTRAASGTRNTIGTLKPGECVSIPVQGISGVFATCEHESVVGCLIKE